MPEVNELYIYFGQYGNEEGIAVIQTEQGPQMLISQNYQEAQALRPVAEALAGQLGSPIRLVRFGQRQVLETFQPGQGGGA